MREYIFGLLVFVFFALVPSRAATSDFFDPSELKYNSEDLVNYINNLHTTWKAHHNGKFRHISHRVMRGMLGVKRLAHSARNAELGNSRNYRMDIPIHFDARQHWPECPSLAEVRDQSSCGSCWAFGATEAMSDRLCIASGGRIKVDVSADDLLSCCTECGYGCDGGDPLEAWKHWVQHGLVTGSNFTSHAGCRPYPFPPCEHHNNHTRFKPCSHNLYPTPSCERSCQSKYGKGYDDDKYYGRKAYAVENNVSSIQKELMSHGPIEVAFEVYADFVSYEEGVYQHHGGKLEGGHAVKMIGWGVDKIHGQDVPYWLIVNSWNSDWGMNGLFKILRGSNECGIESGAVAGLPRLNHTPKRKKNREEDVDNSDIIFAL